MPIPFIIAAIAAAGTGLLGVGGHLSAKDTNENAQRIADAAQLLSEETKKSLEAAQSDAEDALQKLGNSKKKVLEGSIAKFLTAYERIKDVQLNDSVGLNEIEKLQIDVQGVAELQSMSDIYSSAFSSGAAGVATGALAALAVGGNLSIVTGILSMAGSAVSIGELGLAASLVGSALSFGATMTPLSVVLGPLILATGLSADTKAEKNLEKAKVMQAEVDLYREKAEVAKSLCHAIAEQSNMYTKLLKELDSMYFPCVVALNLMTKEKIQTLGEKTPTSSDFTEEEIKLIAVTRALTGAIKSVLDTPMLSKNGDLTEVSKAVYGNTVNMIPALASQAQSINGFGMQYVNFDKIDEDNSTSGKKTIATFQI